MHDLFIDLLVSKFKKNRSARKVLLGTGDAYLLEESRLAKNAATQGMQVPYWGGKIDKDTMMLYGSNTMGKIMMEVRDLMKEYEDRMLHSKAPDE